jgi:hypothetical protein
LYKLKKTNLPNFIRKDRDLILQQRKQEELGQMQILFSRDRKALGDENVSNNTLSAQNTTGGVGKLTKFETKMRQRHERQFKKYFDRIMTDPAHG